MAAALRTARPSPPADTAPAVRSKVARAARLAEHGRFHRIIVSTSTAEIEGTTVGLIPYLQTLSIDTTELEVDHRRGGPLADPQHLYLRDVLRVTGGNVHRSTAYKVRIDEINRYYLLASCQAET